MWGMFIEGLVLGFATGPVCVGYCGPVLVPFLSSHSNAHSSLKSAVVISEFLFGRFLGYMGIGICSGIIGVSFAGVAEGPLTVFATLAIGITLLIFAVFKNFPHLKTCHSLLSKIDRNNRNWGVLFGLLTGLNICPPFVAAISSAATLGSIPLAILYFVAFFLGTLVYFPPLIFVGKFSNTEAFKQIGKIALFLSGAWFFIKGMLMVLTYVLPHLTRGM